MIFVTTNMAATIPVPRTNVAAIIPIQTVLILPFLLWNLLFHTNKKPVTEIQATGLAKFLSCLPAGNCFGNPAVPGPGTRGFPRLPALEKRAPVGYDRRRPTITRGLALSTSDSKICSLFEQIQCQKLNLYLTRRFLYTFIGNQEFTSGRKAPFIVSKS